MQFWIDFDKENASTHDMLSQSHRRAAVRIFKWQSLTRLQIRLFSFFFFKFIHRRFRSPSIFPSMGTGCVTLPSLLGAFYILETTFILGWLLHNTLPR